MGNPHQVPSYTRKQNGLHSKTTPRVTPGIKVITQHNYAGNYPENNPINARGQREETGLSLGGTAGSRHAAASWAHSWPGGTDGHGGWMVYQLYT